MAVALAQLMPVGSGNMQLRVFQEKDLPKTFDEAANLVRQLMMDGQKVALLHAWNVGAVLHGIHENEGRYGSKAVDRIAEQIQCSPRILQEMLRFHKAHPDIKYVNSLRLEWSAARELLRITDVDKRSKMEQTAQDKKMPVREVREWVNSEKAKDTPKDDKPKGKQPKASPAVGYFQKLAKKLEADLEEMKKIIRNSPDMVKIAEDAGRTSDEEYAIIAEGAPGGDEALVKQIGDLADRYAAYLRSSVSPLREVFPK